jgi:hypothetical protein
MEVESADTLPTPASTPEIDAVLKMVAKDGLNLN